MHHGLKLSPLAAGLGAALLFGLPTRAWLGEPDPPPFDVGSHAVQQSALELPANSRKAQAFQRASAHRPAPRPAGIIVVNNCNDSGAGSLRQAALDAADGDTLDLTQLTCSTVTVTSGAIVVEDNLTILGPGRDQLTIDGGYADGIEYSVFYHQGPGTFELHDVTIADAKYTGSLVPDGGCIWSSSSVYLYNVTVTGCTVLTSGSVDARGGAIYAKSVMLDHSTVTASAAMASASDARGGGIYTAGPNIVYSTISNNAVVSNAPHIAAGGGLAKPIGNGVFARFLQSSIIGNQANSNSQATANTGGLYLVGGPVGISNSTISGNHADGVIGGVFSTGETQINDSTIAFNDADTSTYAGHQDYAGLHVNGGTLSLKNVIIANNAAGGVEKDLTTLNTPAITGFNNLVTASLVTLPPDTLFVDPELLPLADNGGPTLSHLLSLSSPAIDAGENHVTLAFDQRGAGYPRVINSMQDIGATESRGDIIFDDGFELSGL